MLKRNQSESIKQKIETGFSYFVTYFCAGSNFAHFISWKEKKLEFKLELANIGRVQY